MRRVLLGGIVGLLAVVIWFLWQPAPGGDVVETASDEPFLDAEPQATPGAPVAPLELSGAVPDERAPAPGSWHDPPQVVEFTSEPFASGDRTTLRIEFRLPTGRNDVPVHLALYRRPDVEGETNDDEVWSEARPGSDPVDLDSRVLGDALRGGRYRLEWNGAALPGLADFELRGGSEHRAVVDVSGLVWAVFELRQGERSLPGSTALLVAPNAGVDPDNPLRRLRNRERLLSVTRGGRDLLPGVVPGRYTLHYRRGRQSPWRSQDLRLRPGQERVVAQLPGATVGVRIGGLGEVEALEVAAYRFGAAALGGEAVAQTGVQAYPASLLDEVVLQRWSLRELDDFWMSDLHALVPVDRVDWSFHDLEPGRWIVLARNHLGLYWRSEPFHVTGGELSLGWAELQPSGSVTLTLAGSGSAPIARVAQGTLLEVEHGWTVAGARRSGAQAELMFDAVPPGTYEAVLELRTGQRARSPRFRVAPQEAARAVVVLPGFDPGDRRR